MYNLYQDLFAISVTPFCSDIFPSANGSCTGYYNSVADIV